MDTRTIFPGGGFYLFAGGAIADSRRFPELRPPAIANRLKLGEQLRFGGEQGIHRFLLLAQEGEVLEFKTGGTVQPHSA